jgi:hypothetical protein
MSPRRDRVPDLLVEQLLRGELPPAKAAEVRAALEVEPGGLERLAALAADDAATLRALPPARFAARVAAEVSPAKPAPRRAPAWAAPALMMAAALALVALWEVGPPPGGQEVVRLKGDAGPLRLYLETPQGPAAIGAGATLRPGDRVQLGYISEAAFGVILSVDGRGAVTQHLPEAGGDGRLEGGREVLLPHGYVLDDAPHHETFLLLTAPRPIDVEQAVDVARRTEGRGPWTDTDGGEVSVTRLSVRKAAP